MTSERSLALVLDEDDYYRYALFRAQVRNTPLHNQGVDLFADAVWAAKMLCDYEYNDSWCDHSRDFWLVYDDTRKDGAMHGNFTNEDGVRSHCLAGTVLLR